MNRDRKLNDTKSVGFSPKKGKCRSQAIDKLDKSHGKREYSSHHREKTNNLKTGGRIVIVQHRHEGVYIARGKEDALVTKNITPGESVYGERRIKIENNESDHQIEYRIWNPFRSKLAAAVLGGIDNIHMKIGSKVLYLGAASGTSVSHVSDIIGPTGFVFAVEFSHRSGRDLVELAKKKNQYNTYNRGCQETGTISYDGING